MATILTLALVIWAFTYKPRKKPLRRVKVRHALPVTAPPILSPAEIARRDKEREKAAKEAERERIKAEKNEKKLAEADLKISQAEIDIQNAIENLNHHNIALHDLDGELDHAKWKVESWAQQKNLKNKMKAEKDVQRIEERIFYREEKVRKAEKALDKAKRTQKIVMDEKARIIAEMDKTK